MKSFEDFTPEQKKRWDGYVAWFAKTARETIADYNNNLKAQTELTRYTVAQLVTMLKSPATAQNQKSIRKLSQFLYEVSSHYKILVNYYANILYYQYIISPITDESVTDESIDLVNYKTVYTNVTRQVEKYNLPAQCKDIVRVAVRDGAFFGICYESDDTFFIQRFDPDYAYVTSVENGVYRFAIDLSYFSGTRSYLLDSMPRDVQSAYRTYTSDRNQRYYEPKDGICIMADGTDPTIILPLFTGLLKDIFDIEDYRLINKANDENSNYKAVTMRVDTDEDGIPLMNDTLIKKYYQQAANNVPEGVGIIVSPFKTDALTFNNGRNADTVELADAESQFWFDSGSSPLLFGSSKATTGTSLNLSVRPNERIAKHILDQIENFFNYRLSSFDKTYKFKIKFTDASIFNIKDVADRFYKAASAGIPGAKSLYASSMGLTPNDTVAMSFLEDKVLNMTVDGWNRPIVTSNTQSGGAVNGSEEDNTQGGRPTKNDDELSDEGTKTREKK